MRFVFWKCSFRFRLHWFIHLSCTKEVKNWCIENDKIANQNPHKWKLLPPFFTGISQFHKNFTQIEWQMLWDEKRNPNRNQIVHHWLFKRCSFDIWNRLSISYGKKTHTVTSLRLYNHIRRRRRRQKAMKILLFFVSKWNRIGWRSPFSTTSFSIVHDFFIDHAHFDSCVFYVCTNLPFSLDCGGNILSRSTAKTSTNGANFIHCRAIAKKWNRNIR